MITFRLNPFHQTMLKYFILLKFKAWVGLLTTNLDNIDAINTDWKNKTYMVFSIVMLMIVLMVMGMIRLISGNYEAQLSLKNSKIEDGVLSLSKLNASLENYQIS